MTDKVVDASAAAAIIFDEPERDAVIARLDSSTLHAPFLLEHEMTNVGVKKARRDPVNQDGYLRALAMLGGLNIQFHQTDIRTVAELAMRYNLSGYDASYLWLSRELGLELVTLDKRLEAAFAVSK